MEVASRVERPPDERAVSSFRLRGVERQFQQKRPGEHGYVCFEN
jgi:hypothetical protein